MGSERRSLGRSLVLGKCGFCSSSLLGVIGEGMLTAENAPEFEGDS